MPHTTNFINSNDLIINNVVCITSLATPEMQKEKISLVETLAIPGLLNLLRLNLVQCANVKTCIGNWTNAEDYFNPPPYCPIAV